VCRSRGCGSGVSKSAGYALLALIGRGIGHGESEIDGSDGSRWREVQLWMIMSIALTRATSRSRASAESAHVHSQFDTSRVSCSASTSNRAERVD
jgi:redox-sensitive bicupin YhaK (pirin superfamily)